MCADGYPFKFFSLVKFPDFNHLGTSPKFSNGFLRQITKRIFLVNINTTKSYISIPVYCHSLPDI